MEHMDPETDKGQPELGRKTRFSAGKREQFSATMPKVAVLLLDAFDRDLVDKRDYGWGSCPPGEVR